MSIRARQHQVAAERFQLATRWRSSRAGYRRRQAQPAESPCQAERSFRQAPPLAPVGGFFENRFGLSRKVLFPAMPDADKREPRRLRTASFVHHLPDKFQHLPLLLVRQNAHPFLNFIFQVPLHGKCPSHQAASASTASSFSINASTSRRSSTTDTPVIQTLERSFTGS